jgi:predicted outer membrane repeat protein
LTGGGLDLLTPTSIVGVGAVTVDGGVFSINPAGVLPGFDVNLSNLTLRHGRRRTGNGGAVSFHGGSTGSGRLTIADSTVEESSAVDGNGGALAVESGVVSLTNVRLLKNTARQHGGAISIGAGARVTVTGGAISGNAAREGSGGGVYAEGESAFHGVSIGANQAAGNGGGIYASAEITVEPYGAAGTELLQNSAAAGGGGIWLDGAAGRSSIRKSGFVGNSTTGRGGAIGVGAGAIPGLTATYNRFTGNAASSGSHLSNDSPAEVAASRNWWGTNQPAPAVNGSARLAPWVVLRHIRGGIARDRGKYGNQADRELPSGQ